MNQSNEAPISVTFSLIDPNDFPILLTFRNDDPKILMSELVSKSSWLKANGYKAQVKKSFGGGEKKPIDIVPDRKCPKCGNQLVNQTTSAGKKMIKCITNKWNPITKQAEGCDYLEWVN